MDIRTGSWREEFKKELMKVIGKRVVEIRVGSYGFDLVFDDGTELEVYCCQPRRRRGCAIGVVAPKYRWFRVKSREIAEDIAEELSMNYIDAGVVGPLEDGSVYVAVNEDYLDDLKKICEKDEWIRENLGC